MISTEFVAIDCLPPGSVLDVETRNRRYHIECLGGSAIRISGHPDLCPTPTPGKLQGAGDRESLEPGIVGRGKCLQFLLFDRVPVTTSRVLRLRLERPPSVQ